MDSQDSYLSIAQSVFDELQSFDLSPIPPHYVVWFRYLEGVNAGLTDAVDERISSDLPITSHFLQSLFDQYCREDEQSEKDLNAALVSIENEASGLQGLAHAMVASTSAFCADVEAAGVSLSTDNLDVDALKALVATLQATTAETIKHNQALKEKLETVVDDVTEIRSFLTRVEEQAQTDFLTKLANRRRFDAVLDEEIEHCAQSGTPLCLILCNIDGFKKFNYEFGHQVGDQVLVLVANTLKQNIKGKDLIARYTGEDIAIALRDAPLNAAMALAERMRESIATRKLVTRATRKELGTITMSFGIAEHRPAEPRDALIEAAYARLQEAKRTGRNKVVTKLADAQECA